MKFPARDQPFIVARDETSGAGKQSKPKTPLIAGSVCGGVVAIAWIIGFSVYFAKRYRRKKRKQLRMAAGKEKDVSKGLKEKVIVPPDPAVILGYARPREDAPEGGRRDIEETALVHQLNSRPPLETPRGTRISEEMIVPPSTLL